MFIMRGASKILKAFEGKISRKDYTREMKSHRTRMLLPQH